MQSYPNDTLMEIKYIAVFGNWHLLERKVESIKKTLEQESRCSRFGKVPKSYYLKKFTCLDKRERDASNLPLDKKQTFVLVPK
jgi:hypothetical protein